MCGIAGVIALDGALSDEDHGHVRHMTALLHHRGPDGRGFHFGERCALGNTRLRILDLSPTADLPMANADGSVVLCYNGEVTNFRELERRHGLRSKYPFRTTSDAEVVLYLYEELGIDFVRQLSGMFAFTLLDTRKGRAWVVRDFFGIRPLFTMRTPQRLYFASEIKSFLDLPGFDRSIDVEGMFDFFSLAYLPRHHTPFEAVDELDGGALIEVNLGTGAVTERRYYDIEYRPDPSWREGPAVEALYEQMQDSVRRNLISDAPLGLTHSGGFDTSSMLALARQFRDEVHTYSVVMEEKSFDESRYQYEMVDRNHHTHHEIRVGPQQVADAFLEHMAFLDEPTGDGAAIPSYLLAKEAKKTVDVLLSGEGGDETFNAYETHVANKARRHWRRVPRPVRGLVRRGVHALPVDRAKLSFDFVAKRFTTGSELGVPESHLYWRHVLNDADQRALMPGCRDLRPTASTFRAMYDGLDTADELNRISVLDWRFYFIGDLMVKNDRTMMAHSVEARFPYADRLLLEFVATLPVGLRIKKFRRRYAQKQAMKAHLPAAINKRSNFGLEMPHSIWFLGELRGFAEHYFRRSVVDRTGFLDGATVERLWREHRDGRVDHGRALWCIINLLVWMDLFVHSDDYKQHLPGLRSPSA